MLLNQDGPIILIEDDEDDKFLFELAFKKLGYVNEIIYFPDGEAALDHLSDMSISPFLILSDINMPKLDGFALRDKIRMDAKLQLRCIPYLFFSTALSEDMVVKAYSTSAQGFFVKEASLDELEKTIYFIMEYWKRCASPNRFSLSVTTDQAQGDKKTGGVKRTVGVANA